MVSIDDGGPVLRIEGVSKRWPKAAEPVLREIDLELAPGELAWLTGENGAGKTTLLRLVAGMIAPDSGRIDIVGLTAEQDRRAYQRRLGLLTAGNSGLYARMTVRQHLDYWARLALIEASERGELVAQTLQRFALDELAGRRADRMSMGQRQRVRIAMTFLHRPRLILLDEPANSLDEEGCAALVRAVDEHRASGGAALWCSPSGADESGTTVDRRLRLSAARLVSE